jgi:phosphatidate cytidylyltransferase
MSYLDQPDDEYRAADGRSGDGRGDRARSGRRATKPAQPARPAWDAATYGRPDDARRPVRRSAPPPDEYPSDRYAGAPETADPYRSDPYRLDPNPSDPYPSDPYRSDPNPSDPYPSDPYPSDPYRSDPYPSDPYPSDPYPSEPDRQDQYPTSSYPAARDSFAPERYTSYRVDLTPLPTDEPPATYVASGLYLDAGDGDPVGAGDAVQPYPGGWDEPEPAPTKGGRNLPAAIGVGVALAAVILGSLFFWRPAFLGVVAVAVGVGAWELVRAIRTTGVNPPLVPLVAGGALMSGLAWWGRADALTFGLVVTVLAAMVWRLADGVWGYGRDVTAATFVAVYVPFLGGFAAMLASPEDGHLRVLVTLAAVVLSDTGGYIIGAKLGKHRMAPLVSPKKSWEGLAGSLGVTALGSAVLLFLLFDVSVWWGLLFGVAVSAAAVVGDLAESMIKRDIGVKDMSSLLPGHGGLMDRLDSIVFAAPTAYLMLTIIAPA